MSITSLKDLKSKAEELQTKLAAGDTGERQQFTEDPRLWYPKLDDKSNGYGVIRFLPQSPGASTPWAIRHVHKFKGPGGWYIENCPTTLESQRCPVCDANRLEWNSGSDARKEVARARKRKTYYFFNIIVVADPATPGNVGKQMMFRAGKKTFDLIVAAAKPDPVDPKYVPKRPFDAWNGNDFTLKCGKVEGQMNYDRSYFDPASTAIAPDDDAIEAIWKRQYDLNKEFLDPSFFRPYEELAARFRAVSTGSQASDQPSAGAPAQASQATAERPSSGGAPSQASAPPAATAGPTEGARDPLSFFEGLLK